MTHSAIDSIKKQNEELAAMAAKLIPQLKAFQKFARQIEDEVEKSADAYDRMAVRAERKGDDWQAEQYVKVSDKIYAVGDKTDAICQKVYDAI